jgi:hypothetical protein
MARDDESWLRGALGNWRAFAHDMLNIRDATLPRIVVYDSLCTYSIASGEAGRRAWSAVAHQGQVTLPTGARIPPAPNAFNAMSEAGNFVAMSLPSIWRTTGYRSEIGLEVFLEGVFFHELVHSVHARFLGRSLSFPAVQQQQGFPEGLNDDSVQDRFRADPAYVRMFEAERDLLFRAVSAASDAEARNSACEALGAMRERRRRHFADAEERWAIVDELALTTEGLGEWASYSWLTRGRGLAPEIVLPRYRGSFWSQEEGLGLFLVVDRLVPGWQRLVFRSPSATAETLLARACGR